MTTEQNNIGVEYKTVDLLQARERFDNAHTRFLKAVERSDGPIWLPEDFLLGEGATPITAIVDRWRDIYKPGKDSSPTVTPTGMVCATDAVLQAAGDLNKAKGELKLVIVEMRKLLKPDAMREQLRTVAMADYDLNKVYQSVLCLNLPINSISWTWSVGHRKIEPIKVTEILKKAEGMGEQNYVAIDTKLSEAGIASSAELARVKVRNFQLRANIHELKEGKWKTRLIVTPGPILLKQTSLPARVWWRTMPQPDVHGNFASSRQKRSDQALSDTPAITIDGIEYYQYVRPPVTNKRGPKNE